jgi:hypothetical protein
LGIFFYAGFEFLFGDPMSSRVGAILRHHCEWMLFWKAQDIPNITMTPFSFG